MINLLYKSFGTDENILYIIRLAFLQNGTKAINNVLYEIASKIKITQDNRMRINYYQILTNSFIGQSSLDILVDLYFEITHNIETDIISNDSSLKQAAICLLVNFSHVIVIEENENELNDAICGVF